MSVLKKYFDYSVNQASRVVDDYIRKVDYDDEGKEFISYLKFDYPSYQKSLGSCDLWSIDSLLKAGINPNFSIHTGLPSRIEGVSTIAEFVSKVDSVLGVSND